MRRYKFRIQPRPGQLDVVVAYSVNKNGSKIRSTHAEAAVSVENEPDRALARLNLVAAIDSLTQEP